MPVRYQVTEAGRQAWESQDVAVPADYRLILWLLDFHGNDHSASGFRRFPEKLLLERAAGDAGAERPPPSGPPSDAEVSVAEMLANGGAYVAEHSVRVASSADGLMQSLASDAAPDVLLLDVQLPDADGFDLLWKLRRQRAYYELPVVMLTVRRDAEDIGKGLRLGADGYVTKPYSKNLLAGVIEKVLKHVHS